MNVVVDIILPFVQMLAGMGVFLFGMMTMSNGLEKVSDKKMRSLFNRISNNRFWGVGIGTVATTIIQSSTALSVMVLGFVNTGAMSLFQATAIMMGANIGTTFDGILAALSNFPVSDYFMLLAPIGVLMVGLDKKGNISRLGEGLIGLGLIFIGLKFMSGSFKDENGYIYGVIKNLFRIIHNPFLLIFLGIVVTALVHSSSLVTTIIITLTASGAIQPMAAFYITLGSNIGTCFTAVIASFGASTNAKRTAFIHVFFNFIGVVLFLIFMLPLESQIIKLFYIIGGNDGGVQVMLFHIIFNVLSAVVFLPFIKQIVWVAEKVVPEGKTKNQEEALDKLDERFLESPSLAIAQVLKQIIVMAKIAETNVDLAMSDVINNKEVNTSTINKNERHLNHLNRVITNYLVKISSLSVSRADEQLIGSLYHVVSDLERIGDHAENFSEAAQAMAAQDKGMSEEAIAELTSMYEKVKLLYRDALYVFENRDEKMFKEVARREDEIDYMKKQFSDNHIERLRSGVCKVESGVMFYDIINNLERVADHLTNVAYSVRPRKTPYAPAKAAPSKV